MENRLEHALNIHFMDGSTIKVLFPSQTEDRYKRKLMREELLKNRMLMIEGDGEIRFIPVENIKYMSGYPAAELADAGVIKGAHFSEDIEGACEAPKVLDTRNASRRSFG